MPRIAIMPLVPMYAGPSSNYDYAIVPMSKELRRTGLTRMKQFNLIAMNDPDALEMYFWFNDFEIISEEFLVHLRLSAQEEVSLAYNNILFKDITDYAVQKLIPLEFDRRHMIVSEFGLSFCGSIKDNDVCIVTSEVIYGDSLVRNTDDAP
jgi:hypothetical protein